jgi:mono/diheme cytochrome c family protein
MTKACGWIVAVVALSACGDNIEKVDAQPGHDVMVDAGRTPVERGRYIMNTLGACTFCHTPLNPDGTRNMNRLFAGWTCADPIPFFDADPTTAGVGCLNARNLTNHPTGLMNATDDAIKNAIRNGTRTDGKKLVPVMPYWVFHNMTDDDLDAIVAYLRTVPGVDNTVPPNEPPWNDINDNNTASPICNGGTCTATPIDPADIPMPSAGTADMASAMRGRYLSSMAGLCIDCHTLEHPFTPPAFPPLFPTPVQTDKFWSGGRTFPKEALGLVDATYPDFITTRNLSSHASGLSGWSVEQIEDAIANGKDRDGNAVCAATHGSLISPYAGLDPQDLRDIANYIKSLPAVDNDTGSNCVGPPVP